MADDGQQALILDNGSYTCRAGLAGEDAPSVLVRSVVGIPQNSATTEGVDPKDCYVGHTAQYRRDTLHLRYAMQDGVVTDWDCMQKIWHHVFDHELRVTPGENPVLLIERPLNPKAKREKSAQIMFEDFNVPAMYLGNSAVLSLYAAGRSTGTVVDMGYNVSHIVPIRDHHALSDNISRLDVGGDNLTSYLTELLAENGYSFKTADDLETVRQMKEKLCYVARNYDDEMQSRTLGMEYDLPDGNTIEVGTPRFKCPELLFQPALFGKDSPGLHKLLFNSIMKCELPIRKELYSNIILSGGTSMFAGLKDRIEKEIRDRAPSSMSLKVIAPVSGDNSPWIGGSILASLSNFQNMLVSKEEYDEEGPELVASKCN